MFEDAVVFYMIRLKASAESIESYIANSKSDTMELFSAIIDMMQARRDASHILASDYRRSQTSRTGASTASKRTNSAQAVSARGLAN